MDADVNIDVTDALIDGVKKRTLGDEVIKGVTADQQFIKAMYDELLDSSLDTKGRTCVVDILNERVEKYNECIYIVTHRPDALDVISGDIILVEKENGVTRISNTYS